MSEQFLYEEYGNGVISLETASKDFLYSCLQYDIDSINPKILEDLVLYYIGDSIDETTADTIAVYLRAVYKRAKYSENISGVLDKYNKVFEGITTKYDAILGNDSRLISPLFDRATGKIMDTFTSYESIYFYDFLNVSEYYAALNITKYCSWKEFDCIRLNECIIRSRFYKCREFYHISKGVEELLTLF